MGEQEYIDATNLAKLRMAKVIVWDVLPMRDHEKAVSGEILQRLRQWIEELEQIVSSSHSAAKDTGVEHG